MPRARVVIWSFLLCLVACTATEGGNTKTGNYRYDYERQPLHPKFGAYHASDDSTRLYVSLDTRDLLFTRKAASGSFQAELELSVRISGLDTLFTDTLNQTVFLEHQEKMPLRTTLEARMPVPSDHIYRAYFSVKDVKRKKEATGSVRLDKKNTSNHQNFLVENTDGEVIIGSSIPSESTIQLSCARCESDQLQLLHQENKASFPPPPYSSSSFIPRSFGKSDLSLSLFFPDSKTISLDLQQGTYLFTTENRWFEGRVMLTTPELFPEVTTVEDMAETLRYITSRSEYESLSREYNQRKSVEEFWIKSAGGQSKAKDLIRIYYGRVREANSYFSESVPGWKTDRGLIHIVFGNAKKIVTSSASETWIYGEEDNLNALVFRFEKADNPQTDNRFLLERSELVKTRWERAITSWRNGRIYAE